MKKTKTSATIIKLQQLAKIMLNESLQNVKYLIVRTTPDQNDIEAAFLVPSKDLCEIIGMTKELAEQTLSIHESFGCTVQITLKQKEVEQYRIQGGHKSHTPIVILNTRTIINNRLLGPNRSSRLNHLSPLYLIKTEYCYYITCPIRWLQYFQVTPQVP